MKLFHVQFSCCPPPHFSTTSTSQQEKLWWTGEKDWTEDCASYIQLQAVEMQVPCYKSFFF